LDEASGQQTASSADSMRYVTKQIVQLFPQTAMLPANHAYLAAYTVQMTPIAGLSLPPV